MKCCLDSVDCDCYIIYVLGVNKGVHLTPIFIVWLRDLSISGLFVDVGNNYSVLDYTNISFVYDDIDDREPLSNGVGGNELVGGGLICILFLHYDDVIMRAMASHIASFTIVYSTVYSRRRSKKTSKLRVISLCGGNHRWIPHTKDQ